MKSYFKSFLVPIESLTIGSKVRAIVDNSLSVTLYRVDSKDYDNETVLLTPIISRNPRHFAPVSACFGSRYFDEDSFFLMQCERL